jgi:signal transduction histidine kinase
MAAIYVAAFSASVLLLFAFFYWSTAGYLTRSTHAAIEAEVSSFAERYRNEGLGGLTALIRQRLSRQPAGTAIYLLAGPDLTPLVGNLDRWPRVVPDADGWIRFRLGGGDEPDATPGRWASAKVFVLAGGFNLLVGRDMQELEGIQSTIARTVAWGLAITVLLALLGGGMMSRSLARRLGSINDSISRIMAGDLHQRLPSSGSGDEFDQLVVNVNRMLDRIEALMADVQQVSDNIAHDLRTPLARLRNRLEDLRPGNAGGAPTELEAWRRDVDEAIAEADALLATFNALLRIARIEASSRRQRFTDVELAALLADVEALYEPLAEQRGQHLKLRVDAGVAANAAPWVRGDRDLLFQALANLVDNAIKYVPAGGRIDLGLGREDGATVVTVSDDGPGIPAAARERVLQRFWRLDDSRTSPGSGLGLSLVDAVVRLHGAAMEMADNDPGLRVVIRFPETLPGARARARIASQNSRPDLGQIESI